MHKGKILIIDSGVGGLPYAKEIFATVSSLKKAISIDYLADNQGFPYGTKSELELKNRLNFLASTIAKAQPAYDFIVIACNTASIYGYAIFRQFFDKDQIIVTTPNLYLQQHPHTQCLLLLASGATCKAYGNRNHIQVIPADDLIRWVEQEYHRLAPAQQQQYLNNYYQIHIKPLGGDTLLLGCTHFLHLKDNFLAIENNKLAVVDTKQIVAHSLYQAIMQRSAIIEVGNIKMRYFYLTLFTEKENLYYKDIAGDYNFELNNNGLS